MNGQNLNFNTNPIMGFINEYMDNKGNQKEILSKETWGPPYYKFKLNFNTPDV